ncbi:MAG: RseA family anti-sigma factor [Pseudomonadales bacterium]|nr:RseA family anti-sigma factor [Pseudomonadales bacterium]
MGFDKDRILDESLSALMDNELSELELRRLLKQLASASPEIQAQWQRYHMARSALHGEPIVNISTASTAKILAAIAAEPAHKTGETSSQIHHGWLQHAAKFAVAASVALTVFFGLKSWLIQDFNSIPVSQEVAGVAGSEDEHGMMAVDADAQRRLNEYIQRVSIQYSNEPGSVNTSLFEEFPLLVPVNQVEAITTQNR